MSLSNLTFSEAPVPVRERTTGPNPFAEVVGTLSVGGPAQKFNLSGVNDEKTNEDLRDSIRLLRAAGKDRDLTTRIKVTDAGTKKDPAVTVMFWVVDRITRPRKESDAQVEGEGSTDAAEEANAVE